MVNLFKTAMLFLIPAALGAGIGYAIAGLLGLSVCAALCTCVAAVAFFSGDGMVLKLHRAEVIPESQAPGLYALASELARRAKIPTPSLYRLPDAAPQVFATGRTPSHGAIALSRGLLALLSTEELAAVVGHAMDHLRSGEARTMTMVAGLVAGLISLSNMFHHSNFFGRSQAHVDKPPGVPADAFLWVLLAPVAGALVRGTVHPSRQFHADEASAHLIGDTHPLCAALAKIEAGIRHTAPQFVSPATAHLFFCSPASNEMSDAHPYMHLFQTHPTVRERLHKLHALGGGIHSLGHSATGSSDDRIQRKILSKEQANV